MRGMEIIEEIDFLKSQGENRHRVLSVISQSPLKTESLKTLFRCKGRRDLHEFLFKEESEREIPEHGEASRYLQGCRCQLCRDANTRRHASLRKTLANRDKDPNDPRHGTPGFYTNHGCRCNKCGESHKNAMAKQHAVRLAKPIDPVDSRHGTSSFYVAYGCRCDPCKQAMRATQVRRKERTA